MSPAAKPWALSLAGAGVFLFVVHSLLARGQWERDKTVELCVDAPEVQLLADQDDGETWRTLDRWGAAGVSSVAIYWDPTRSLADLLREWSPRVPEGMSLTLRPEPVPFSDWSKGWPRTARVVRGGPVIRNVLFSGEAVMGYPDLTPVKDWLSGIDCHLPWVEFSRQKGFPSLRDAFPQRVVRAHTFGDQEMSQMSAVEAVSRLRRAVRERGARFLYVRLFPGFSRPQNDAFVMGLLRTLREDGFRLGAATARYGEWPASRIPLPSHLRAGLAFGASVILPLWAFLWALGRRSVALPTLTVGGAGLATGLLVAAFLSTPSFVLGFDVFRGVKLAFLFPLGAALFSLYRGDEIRHLLQEPVTVGRFILGSLVLGGVAYFFLRTGHGTVADASSLELKLRGTLESLLGVRPRFKEFLIGHPSLWLGFYLRSRGGDGPSFLPRGQSAVAQALRFLFHDPRPFLLVGLIGSLSIVNTFCHAHTPLWISLVRTFHGFWMGSMVGGGAVAGLRWAEARWQKIP